MREVYNDIDEVVRQLRVMADPLWFGASVSRSELCSIAADLIEDYERGRKETKASLKGLRDEVIGLRNQIRAHRAQLAEARNA